MGRRKKVKNLCSTIPYSLKFPSFLPFHDLVLYLHHPLVPTAWSLYSKASIILFTALGQVMLYVDGMNGVMEHNETVQWLYALIASKFRLVVKTALKLLLVFIEYVETNCLLLIKAVHAVDTAHGKQHNFCGMWRVNDCLFNVTINDNLLSKFFTV